MKKYFLIEIHVFTPYSIDWCWKQHRALGPYCIECIDTFWKEFTNNQLWSSRSLCRVILVRIYPGTLRRARQSIWERNSHNSPGIPPRIPLYAFLSIFRNNFFANHSRVYFQKSFQGVHQFSPTSFQKCIF